MTSHRSFFARRSTLNVFTTFSATSTLLLASALPATAQTRPQLEINAPSGNYRLVWDTGTVYKIYKEDAKSQIAEKDYIGSANIQTKQLMPAGPNYAENEKVLEEVRAAGQTMHAYPPPNSAPGTFASPPPTTTEATPPPTPPPTPPSTPPSSGKSGYAGYVAGKTSAPSGAVGTVPTVSAVTFDEAAHSTIVPMPDNAIVTFVNEDVDIAYGGRPMFVLRHQKGSAGRFMERSILHPNSSGSSLSGGGVEFLHAGGGIFYDSGMGTEGDSQVNSQVLQAKKLSQLVVDAVASVRQVPGHEAFTPPAYSTYETISKYRLRSDGSR